MVKKNKILVRWIVSGFLLLAVVLYVGFNLMPSYAPDTDPDQIENISKDPQEESPQQMPEEVPEVVPEQPQLKSEANEDQSSAASGQPQKQQSNSSINQKKSSVNQTDPNIAQEETKPYLTQKADKSIDSDALSEVIDLCNAKREELKLPKLSVGNDAMQKAANIRAQEIKTNFSHTRPDGSNFFSILKEFGINYLAAGENIAWGQTTPKDVVNAWMNSEGHRANILSSKFTHICVGLSGTHWVQIFTA